MSIGTSYSCAVENNNSIYCWGNGYSPQQVSDPNLVFQGKTIAQVSVASYQGSNVCALTTEGKAYCWGSNSYGQLGTGNTNSSSVPVQVNMSGVLDGKTIKSISTSGVNTCVIASDDKAYCWGYNSSGQLGNGNNSNSIIPVAVDTSGVLNGKNIQSISVGGSHTCLITTEGKPYCWGRNDVLQLGNYSSVQAAELYYGEDSNIPVEVNLSENLAGKTFKEISASSPSTPYKNTCAISTDNKTYCWGEKSSGKIGTGSSGGDYWSIPIQTIPY